MIQAKQIAKELLKAARSFTRRAPNLDLPVKTGILHCGNAEFEMPIPDIITWLKECRIPIPLGMSNRKLKVLPALWKQRKDRQ